MIYFPECSTVSGLVIIGGETPDISEDLNTVVEKGEEDAFSDCVQLISGHNIRQLSNDSCSLG